MCTETSSRDDQVNRTPTGTGYGYDPEGGGTKDGVSYPVGQPGVPRVVRLRDVPTEQEGEDTLEEKESCKPEVFEKGRESSREIQG